MLVFSFSFSHLHMDLILCCITGRNFLLRDVNSGAMAWCLLTAGLWVVHQMDFGGDALPIWRVHSGSLIQFVKGETW